MCQRERQKEQFYNLEIPSVMLVHLDTLSLINTVCFRTILYITDVLTEMWIYRGGNMVPGLFSSSYNFNFSYM